jgi:hypothetical protein
MTKAYISEYSGPPQGPNGSIIMCGREPSIAQQVVDYSGGAAASAAFNANTTFIRLHVDSIASFRVSTAGTAATTSYPRMAANATEFFGVQPARQSFRHHQHLRIYPMMGSGPVADTRSVEQVQSLLAIIADPKAAKAALAQLADAQKSADEKLAAANAKAADLDGREASISSREAAVAKGEIKLAAAVQKQKESADAMNADLTARIEAVTAREIAVSKVDNANAEREVSVSNREAAIAAKETNLQASYDEANAAKRKYDEALENLRSLVSQ